MRAVRDKNEVKLFRKKAFSAGGIGEEVENHSGVSDSKRDGGLD